MKYGSDNIFIVFREKEYALARNGLPLIQPHKQSGPRFTGAGFNLRPDKTAA